MTKMYGFGKRVATGCGYCGCAKPRNAYLCDNHTGMTREQYEASK